MLLKASFVNVLLFELHKRLSVRERKQIVLRCILHTNLLIALSSRTRSQHTCVDASPAACCHLAGRGPSKSPISLSAATRIGAID